MGVLGVLAPETTPILSLYRSPPGCNAGTETSFSARSSFSCLHSTPDAGTETTFSRVSLSRGGSACPSRRLRSRGGEHGGGACAAGGVRGGGGSRQGPRPSTTSTLQASVCHVIHVMPRH